MMKCNAAGLQIIKNSEGCRLKSYRCPAGLWTIGWGHTGPDVFEGMTIPQQYADDLLVRDVARFEIAIRQTVTAPLNENQFSALVSFAYNCKGWGASTLVRKLNQSDYAGAAAEFPRWVHAGSTALPGLVIRREAERKLFLS